MGKRFLMRDFTIGARLKGLRADAGLTQRQVADDLGIPVSTYSNYENDNRYPAPVTGHKKKKTAPGGNRERF